jgi:hypothetical protein
MIVIAGDVRVQSDKSEFLEQMSLPQIADIVVNSAGFAPSRHRPNVAGEDDDESEPAKKFQQFHHESRRTRAGPHDCGNVCSFW